VRIEDDKRNVYLIGLMGAGKTTIGKALAKRLGYRFVDSDHEIEARTGVSLPTIFEIEGEDGFQNRQNLEASGFVIYLDVPLPTLYERTRHDKKRPLLQVSDPRRKLRELYAERDPLYREIADLIVSGSRITVQSVLHLLIKELGEPWKR
jgi:shikimate kinase